MLSFLIAYVLISVISLITGYLTDYYFQTALLKKTGYTYKPFIFYLLTGLITLTVLGEWAALFIPVNFWMTIILTTALFFFPGKDKKDHRPFFNNCFDSIKAHTPVHIFSLMAIGALIITINTGPTLMDDTESYHIQMVKWIQEYGSPKGIANLHSRYGFNSAWFTSIALFSLPSSSINTYTLLNGILSFWFCCYLISNCFLRSQKVGKRNSFGIAVPFFIILCLSLFLWPIIRGSAGTSNYDLISSVIVFILFAELVKSNKFTESLYLQWILFPLFIFTVRVTNFPFLLITVFVFFYAFKKKEYKTQLFVLASGVIIIIPFLLRNLFLSGYLFYPSVALDLFSVDWKVEKSVPLGLLHFIKYFNRVNEMYLPISSTELVGFPDWIPLWYKHLFRYDKILVTFSGVALLSTFLFTKRIKRLKIEVKVFIIVVTLSLISWFFIAPDPRFVYGGFLCIIFFATDLLITTLNGTFNASLKLPTLVLGFVLLGFTILKIIKESNYRNWIFPRLLNKPNVNIVEQRGFKYKIPEKVLGNWNKRCYGTSLPCIYELNPRLIPRGKNIKDGFKIDNSD